MLKKVTVVVPEELLARAQNASGEGITHTIRMGLKLVAAGRAYDELRRVRGRVKLAFPSDVSIPTSGSRQRTIVKTHVRLAVQRWTRSAE